MLFCSELLTRCSVLSFSRNSATSTEHANLILGQTDSNILIQPVTFFAASNIHETFLISSKYTTVVPEVYLPPSQRLHIYTVFKGLLRIGRKKGKGKTSGAGFKFI